MPTWPRPFAWEGKGTSVISAPLKRCKLNQHNFLALLPTGPMMHPGFFFKWKADPLPLPSGCLVSQTQIIWFDILKFIRKNVSVVGLLCGQGRKAPVIFNKFGSRWIFEILRGCPPPPGNPAVLPAGTPRAAGPKSKENPRKNTRPRGRQRGHPAGPDRRGGAPSKKAKMLTL